MAHHGDGKSMSDRLSELLRNEPGPTLDYPNGRLSSDDDGEITVRMAANVQKQVVVMEFGIPTKWIGFTRDQAREIARMLMAKADELQGVSP